MDKLNINNNDHNNKTTAKTTATMVTIINGTITLSGSEDAHMVLIVFCESDRERKRESP